MGSVNSTYEVIIIGGGPAGIATSLTLTARGIKNGVVEAQLHPSNKPGEALPPNAKPLLKKLGLTHLVEDPKHIHYYGNKVRWGTDDLQEKEFLRDIYGYGYLLDRIYFENQLRAHLKKNGADFFEGYKLKKLVNESEGLEMSIEKGGEVHTFNPRFIVDATGRKASVCHQLGNSKLQLDTQFVLTFSVSLKAEIERQIYVESTENGWWYAAPKSATELTLMFFTLKEIIPSKPNLPAFLRTELDASPHLSQWIQQETLDFDNVKLMPSGTSKLEVPYGKNWLAVGDAAYSFDPISSYGITSALASGFYGGNALASALQQQEDAFLTYRYVMETAFEAYLEKLALYYGQEKRWGDSVYWKGRG